MSRHQDSFDRNIAGARQQLIEQLTQFPNHSSPFLLQDPGGRLLAWWRRRSVPPNVLGAGMKNIGKPGSSAADPDGP
jgi:hypothetical protein